MADSLYDYNPTEASDNLRKSREARVSPLQQELESNEQKIQAYFGAGGEGAGTYAPGKNGYRADIQALMDRQGSLRSQIGGFESSQGVLSDPQSTREREMYEGAKFGEAVLGPKGLGRLGSDQEIKDVLEQYKQYADKGYDAPVLEAQRQSMQEEINRGTATQSRQLAGALARSGVKGAVAGSQMMGLQAQAMQQKGALERDIFVKNADLKRQSLEKYGSALGEIKSFDLGQVAKEKNIVFQAGMGIHQIGSTERSSQKQSEIAAANRAAAGGGKIICTELYKQGLMPKEIYEKDQEFGLKMIKEQPEIMEAYWTLASPIVNIMRKSPFITKYVVKPLANSWAYHIGGKPNFCGSIVYAIGYSLCTFISRVSNVCKSVSN